MTIGYPLMKTCTQFIGVSELLEIPIIEISDLIVMQLNYIINYCHSNVLNHSNYCHLCYDAGIMS